MEEETLYVDVNIDGFKITLSTKDPDAVKAYSGSILDMLHKHVTTISNARAFTEVKMIELMNDIKKPEKLPIPNIA